MPRTHISLAKGRPATFHKALFDNIYEAMRETFNVPEGDRFMTISEHAPEHFCYGVDYLGIDRTPDMMMIQITCNNTRTVEQKKALYARIVERLSAELAVRPGDVFISLVEVTKENWSFGNGIAQLA